eukprot:TCALIF_04734-PA protein Name:"Protein of unknown function" AED:0.40 eAED:0.63 QI:88/0/0/1/0/0/2/0/150
MNLDTASETPANVGLTSLNSITKTSLSSNSTIPRFPFELYFSVFLLGGPSTSEVIWFQVAQQSLYSEEINALQFGKKVSSSSPIKSLLPTLQSNTLTMTSRLDYANLPYRSTHPIILPKHPITRKYVLHIHVSNFYASARLTMSLVRQHH